jgi:glycosyltransferase involved in cell wall biosynthesis
VAANGAWPEAIGFGFAEMTTSATGDAPLLVIVTPVYNGARFLAETMDSVQAQTYSNLVHIELDNASTDGTADILKRYANARIPVSVHRNDTTVPMAANWNKALTFIPPEAKYFRVLCADDVITPDFSTRMIALAERNPSVVVVGCDLQHHRGEGTFDQKWDTDRDIFPGREAVGRFFENRGMIIAHQTIFRSSVLGTRHPFLEADMAANDTDAVLDLLRNGDWGFVHERLATTREHPDSDTSTFVKPLKMDLCEHLALLERHAEYGLGKVAGRRMTRTYRRYYLRLLMRWRVRGEGDRVQRHIAALRGFKVGLSPLSFLDAIVDWPLARLGLRPVWKG